MKSATIFHGGDGPESGFEALVQVVKCNQIRWREKARRILILATDNHSHLASFLNYLRLTAEIIVSVLLFQAGDGKVCFIFLLLFLLESIGNVSLRRWQEF